MSGPLKREDYEEPACLLDMSRGADDAPAKRLDLRRVLQKLDEYLQKCDYSGAERHIKYWLAEAEANRDLITKHALLNECMGMYRNAGKREEALSSARQGLALAEKLGYSGTVAGATTLLNAATVYKWLGDPEKACELYSQAKDIYESQFAGGEYRLGGLYNNMALALVDLKRYAEAYEMYEKAVDIMSACKDCEAEQAITLLNEADAAESELGPEDGAEKIESLLDRAEALLNTPTLAETPLYAYYCGRCAGVFDHYGRFAFAAELRERAGKNG
ncbi:MAG: tetratricopeptide repeat protein [Clostridia bacterium]|nr:tetratricopeptide repeat protein [Clostridia bacterium]